MLYEVEEEEEECGGKKYRINTQSNECHRIANAHTHTVVDLQFGFIGFLYFDLFGIAAAVAVFSFHFVAVQSHTTSTTSPFGQHYIYRNN